MTDLQTSRPKWRPPPKLTVTLECGHTIDKARPISKFHGKKICENCVDAIKVGTKLDCGHPKKRQGNIFDIGSMIICSDCSVKYWG
jgi:hypothetical protein